MREAIPLHLKVSILVVLIIDDKHRMKYVHLTVTTGSTGRVRALLCCDVSTDGQTVAAGTDLQGDDALILYWYFVHFGDRLHIYALGIQGP
jgi:hypothetical protein